MREKVVEQKLIQAVRRSGGLALKFVSPGFNGVPDRLLLFTGGRVAFAEVKSPGQKPRPLQVHRMEQLVVLQNTLDESVKLTGDREAEKTTAELLDAFIATKRLEGRSEGNIELYLYNIRAVLGYSDKNACVMTTDDIRQCLVRYQEEHKIGKVTLD